MITLSKLSYDDLDRISAWRVIEETIDEEDVSLEPAKLDNIGLVEKSNGEVWCLCKVIFFNGDEHKASAICRGDDNQGPLLLTVSNGVEDISLIMPPAPDFVLDLEGPVAFCRRFDKPTNDVFPLRIDVIPKFKLPPHDRSIVIDL